MTRRDEVGFVALEWVTAVALLLFPVVLLVASLPTWVERKHAAVVAAREAAAVIARDPAADPVDATRVAEEVAAHHGIAAGDVEVRLRGGRARRDYVTVEVEVRMPAIAVPGLDAVDAWSYTAVQHRRIDDYRSL